MGSKTSLLVYEWPPIKIQYAKFGIWMGQFFKIFPNLNQNWFKFKKILEKSGGFVKIWSKKWADWYLMGHLFLKKLIFAWVYFWIPRRYIPSKTKLEHCTSLPRDIDRCIQVTTYNSPEKWLHNWIATGPNKSKKHTRLTSPAHTTHGKVRITPLEIWVVNATSLQATFFTVRSR